MEQAPAETLTAQLGACGAQLQAQLDGFKSRKLTTATVLDETRRWLYHVEWSLAAEQAAPPTSHLVLLVVGTSLWRVSNRVDAARRLHAIALTTPLRATSGTRQPELRTMDAALSLLQAAIDAALSIWLCTSYAQPISHSQNCCHAGLWGLARAYRQEFKLHPAWCVDVQGDAQLVVKTFHHHAVQLLGGSVRGLQLGGSVEPEAACGAVSLHVPRLVAAYDAQAATLYVDFKALSRALVAHVSSAMACLDSERLLEAMLLQDILCQQYVRDAICRLQGSQVRLWHHKLLCAWYASQPPPRFDRAIVPSELSVAHPETRAEMQLAECCGPRLVDALSGAVAYQELLFPGGSMEVVLPVYQDSIGASFCNGSVVAAVGGIVALLPGWNRIVALEVGAGTGGTASSILPVLESVCKRYIFTDVSEVFLWQARARFPEFLFIEYMLLNVDADPRLQGFAAHECDVLVSTNCLHATPFMRNTLRHCKQLLCAGGVLVANEGLGVTTFAQITFGLTDGWWLFSESHDPERVGQHCPMLSWRQWQALLIDNGFHLAHCMQSDACVSSMGQAVIVAQTAVPPLRWTLGLDGAAHFLSGGLAGLALLTANLLVKSGARQLVLSSRSDRVVMGSENDWALLSERGADVRRLRCDASDDSAVHAIVRALHGEGCYLGSVFHAAHQLVDATFKAQIAVNFRATYGPKVHGAVVLHTTVLRAPLHAYNVFSSVAGLMGSPGQAPHSAANAWLDSMAGWRHRSGMSGQSVNWGAVAEVGYAARHGADRRADKSGLGAISQAVVIAALSSTLLEACTSFVVLPVDWSKLLMGSREACGLVAPYFHLRGQAFSAASITHLSSAVSLTTSAISLELVLKLVRRTAGGAVDVDAPLMEAGVDSLGAVDLRNQLQANAAVGTTLPSTLVFDHPTVRALARFLAPATQPTHTNVRFSTGLAAHTASIALLQMQATLPRGVIRCLSSPMTATGYDTFTSVPPSRWRPIGGDDDMQQRCRHAAFVHNMELFDHRAFSLAAAEASTMDPQQRQLLAHGYQAFHAEGLMPNALLGSDVGVFIGITSTEWMSVPRPQSVYNISGAGHCFAAGRISYVLGLHGASLAVDTACSSFLVSACGVMRALQFAECQMSLLAGVQAMLVPSTPILYATGGLTSTRGRSHTFDSRADGFARGEACGAAILELGTHHGKAFVLGGAVRQDGKSASLTAPNGHAQQILLLAARADTGTSARLSCLQAHGTGTALGDPVEVGAFMAVQSENGDAALEFLSVGGAKANVGHAEPAAGMVGTVELIRGLLRLCLVANAQLRAMNPHVMDKLSTSACTIPTQSAQMSLGSDLSDSCIHGVSSFGLGGTIAHVVMHRVAACCACDTGRLCTSAMPHSSRRCSGYHRSPLIYLRGSFWCNDQDHPFAPRSLPSLSISAGAQPTATVIFRSAAADFIHLVQHHTIQNRVIFPGAGYLEMACAAAVANGGVRALHAVLFLQPFVVDVMGAQLECVRTGKHFELRDATLIPDASPIDRAAVHCSGTLAFPYQMRRIDLVWECRGACASSAHVLALYDRFDNMSLQYGPDYRTLIQAWSCSGQAAARLQPRSTAQGVQVHPADLDDALCLSMLVGVRARTSDARGEELQLPFSLEAAHLSSMRGPLWAVVAQQGVRTAGVTVHLAAMSEHLAMRAMPPLSQLDGFETRTLRADGRVDGPVRPHVYTTTWVPLLEREQRMWTMHVIGHLHIPASTSPLALAPPRTGLHQWAAQVSSCQPCNGGHLLCAMVLSFGGLELGSLAATELALALAQAHHATGTLVTPLVMCTSQQQCCPTHQGAWGLARSIRAEARLSLQCVTTKTLAHRRQTSEPEAVVYGASSLVPRLMPAPEVIDSHVRLCTHVHDDFNNLLLEPQPALPQISGTVLLRVHAVSLHAFDVIRALDDLSGSAIPLEFGASGRVTERALCCINGDGIFGQDRQQGGVDQGVDVFGIVYAPLASVAPVRTTCLALKPASLTFEQVCTLPVTWSTSHVALECARVRAGCSMVVQIAFGGVERTSADYAHWLSASIMGTASRPHRCRELQASGMSAVCSSFDGATFSTGVAHLLTARRLPVVLNSLSLAITATSFAIVGESGVIQDLGEIGKWIRLASGSRIAYYNVPFDATVKLDSPRIHSVLDLLRNRVRNGVTSSLPLQSFDMHAQHQLAFRMIQRGFCAGIVVISMMVQTARLVDTHVVTGGTSGLGLLTGRWLAQQGAHKVVLASRRARLGHAAMAEGQILELMSSTQTSLAQCDTGEAAHMRRLVAQALPSISSVWHAAGVVSDAIIAQQDASSLGCAYAPKVHGAERLCDASSSTRLAVCALFSSVAGLLGGTGQANYAAANTCLDALAASRRAHGVIASSVQWGAWAEVGMATSGAAQKRMEAMEISSGFVRIRPAQGLAALVTAIHFLSPSVLGFAPITWSLFLGTGSGVPVFLSAFAPKSLQSIDAHVRAMTPQRRSIDGNVHSTGALHKHVSIETVLEIARHITGSAVDADAPLMEAGLDSLGAIEMRNKLSDVVGDSRVLPSTVVFDHPTTRQLANKVGIGAQAAASMELSAMSAHAELPSLVQGSVAVNGASMLLPAGASTYPIARSMVICGCDIMSEVPSERWCVAAGPVLPEPIASRVRHGSFVRGIELADYVAFAVSPAEASAMDPCQCLLLERGYTALHEAGLDRSELHGSLVGVFLGFAGTDFSKMLTQMPAGSSVYAATGSTASVACGRLSYALGLHGPCVSYDTACSAALAACHGALRALQLRECDIGTVLGVNLMLAPGNDLVFATAGMTSPTGRSHTFDARADGYARGEACGSCALRSHLLHVSVSLNGSALRQDGRSASLTAPNGNAQQQLLVAALLDAQAATDAVALHEAHGTGTSLGDPIETGAVAAVSRTRSTPPLTVVGIKANIGHTEPAAGVIGLLNLAMSLQWGEAPPNAQLRVLNPHVAIALPSGGCALSTLASELNSQHHSDIGGVSSFGYSGTIAHTVLRRMAADDEPPQVNSARLRYHGRPIHRRDSPHPFALHSQPSSHGGLIFRSTVGEFIRLVHDHVVQSRVIFPGAGYLEMARAAVKIASALAHVFFLQPLTIEATDTQVWCAVSDGRFEVRSGEGTGASEDAQVYCAGACASSGGTQRIDRAVMRTRFREISQAADVEAFYTRLNKVGLQYGPGYRTLIKAWGGDSDSAACLRSCGSYERSQMHPAQLDASFQLCGLSPGATSRIQLPFAVDTAMMQCVPEVLWATFERGDSEVALVRTAESKGHVAAHLDGFRTKPLIAHVNVKERRRWHYELDWLQMRDMLASESVLERRFLMICSLTACEGGVDAMLLRAASWRAIAFHATALSHSPGHGSGATMNELSVLRSALRMLQVQAQSDDAPPMWLCTSATQPVTHARVPFHSGLWGLARSCRQERLALPLCCIDLQGGAAEPWGVLCRHATRRVFQLKDGSIRGLRSEASAEPEVSLGTTAMCLHVPRLTAPYRVKTAALDVPLASLCLQLRQHTRQAMTMLAMDRLRSAYDVLEVMCQEYVRRAMGIVHTPAVVLWHHRLLCAWYSKQQPPPPEDADKQVMDAVLHSDLWAEIQLAERCGPQLVEVFSGTCTYQELLFPSGGMELVLPVYERSPLSLFYNDCAVAAVEKILSHTSFERRGVSFTVFEIGAGSGGTASSVLPVVQPVCRRYIFTDVSDVFLRQAQLRFPEFGFIEFALFNVDADPRLQGFALHQCDVVISTNCLHATPFMRNTLHHCEQLLGAGGMLIANEIVGTFAFAQITFGMTDGWWLFSESIDPERIGQASPLLSWRQWQALLLDSNFLQAQCTQGGSFLRGQALVIAQTGMCCHTSSSIAANGAGALISGGLGGLGLLTARLLIVDGARRIVLSSRSDCVLTGSESEWAWLAASGASVYRVRCDVSDDSGVRTMADAFYGDGLCFNGIFHAAHALADATIANQHVLNFRVSYAPKVHGAAALHAVCLRNQLRTFNVYSSIAGLMGSAGQSPHSAASSWLDSATAWRRRGGVPSQSVNWGAVQEVGYAARAGADRRADVSGSGAISHAVASAALCSTLLSGCRSFAVLPADWSTLLAGINEVRGYLTPYSHLQARTCHLSPRGVSKAAGSSDEGDATRTLGLDAVLKIVRHTAGTPVDTDAPLMEAGVDSLGAVELRDQLQRAVGDSITLPSTLIFDHPTARSVEQLLAQTADPPTAQASTRSLLQPDRAAQLDSGVLLASMSSLLPNGEHGRPGVWSLVTHGLNACEAVPAERWDDHGRVTYGAFLRGSELFDPASFSLGAPETSAMDPQQRLVMERGYTALHAAGFTRGELTARTTAVFIGIMSTEFRDAFVDASGYALTGTGHCFAAGRLSYALGLHGSCSSIDVACSAALVACDHAKRALHVQDAAEAIVAGVNMMFVPATQHVYAVAGLTSPCGRPFVFDARANGFVRGEGCCAGVLQALAVPTEEVPMKVSVAGSAVRQNGRSASLTAPNGHAQQLLLCAVLSDASSTARKLQLLEAAANGSSLGDAIEVGAIAAALIRGRVQSGPLPMGSTKANVGHTESASGVAGMVKLLCAMTHPITAPNAQLARLSSGVASSVDSCSLPVQVAAAPRDGTKDGVVSSFGLGGTVASVVLTVSVLTRERGCAMCLQVSRRRQFSWRRPVSVRITKRGAMSGLVLTEQPACPIGVSSREAPIQVHAVGLNFKDVLNVLGQLPSRFLTPVGDDCAGVTIPIERDEAPITARATTGAKVFGTVPGCLHSFAWALADPQLLVRRPKRSSAMEACTLPAVWTTAHVVLKRASMSQRMKFLLHGAAGGVGLSSVCYMRWLGARPAATAGHRAKHTVLRSLELDTCCSSRDAVAFGFGLPRAARGHRFVGICNSLSEDFIPVSTASLCEDGAFCEIGKRGAWSVSRMGAGSMCAPCVIDLATDIPSHPLSYHSMLCKLATRLRLRVVSGLPASSFSVFRVHDALRLLRAGSHVGKVVVVSPLSTLRKPPPPPLAVAAVQGLRTDSAATQTAAAHMEAILTMVSTIAGVPVAADEPLMDAGVDSLGAVELRNQLQTASRTKLPGTFMFDHPTARQLEAALTALMDDSVVASHQQVLAPTWIATRSTLVSIIGQSAVLPGSGCGMLPALRAFACGADMVSEVPSARWDVRFQPALCEPIASRVRHLGFVHGAELVDAAAFALSSSEAVAMDPCQRLLLEHGYAAMYHAAICRASLSDSLTGTFLGFAGSLFAMLLAASPAGSSVYAATGSSASIAAGRLSYMFGLHGPCVTYDTACSSALAAGHEGLRALQLAECTVNLVCAVALMLAPDHGVSFAIAGMTSVRGRSHTFDARADGYARGEACGALLLRADAEHAAHTVLQPLGSAVRQDGRSASLTAPSGGAQQSLLSAALQDASEDAVRLVIVEAHGTGTKLGDPIEAGSLNAVLLATRYQPLSLSGVKASIAHAEPAAGMTGLLRLVLGLWHCRVAPNAQLRVLNAYVGGEFRGGHKACILPVQPLALLSRPHTGGVSSFGYSGTIAHSVLTAHAAVIAVLKEPLHVRRRAFALPYQQLYGAEACSSDVSVYSVAWRHEQHTCSHSEPLCASSSLWLKLAAHKSVCWPSEARGHSCFNALDEPPLVAHDADLCIIGGGMVGLSIARDAASCGFSSIVLEKENMIGGVWAKNAYPGLRLQLAGSTFRCWSLAPQWMDAGPGKADAMYRPDGCEVLCYICAMACHDLIDLRTDTAYVSHSGRHDAYQVFTSRGLISTRGVVFAPGAHETTAGAPHWPIQPSEVRNGAYIVHSSALSDSGGRFSAARVKYVVGSSKAALDILETLNPEDRGVVWAHRGHIIFHVRDRVHERLAGERSTVEEITQAKTGNLYLKNQEFGAAFDGMLRNGKGVSVGEPIAAHPAMRGGVISEDTLAYVRRFLPHQRLISALCCRDGALHLICTDGCAIVVGPEDAAVLCTGQRVAGAGEGSYWRRARLNQNGLFHVSPFSNVTPVNGRPSRIDPGPRQQHKRVPDV